MKNDSPHSILILDDEEALRLLLGEILVGAGYTVYTAVDGIEAMEILKTHNVDVALLDIQIPGMDGLEVLKHITEHHPATKSIVLTGYADLRHATEARKFGAVDFIGKPYTLEEIVGSLERSLAVVDSGS